MERIDSGHEYPACLSWVAPLIEDPVVNAVAQATVETMVADNMSWHIGDVCGRITAAGCGGGPKILVDEKFALGRLSVEGGFIL